MRRAREVHDTLRSLVGAHAPGRELAQDDARTGAGEAYLMRDERGAVEVIHDRHVMGLFARAVWQELIADAGFQPLVIPFEHSSNCEAGHEVFLGLRPDAAAPV